MLFVDILGLTLVVAGIIEAFPGIDVDTLQFLLLESLQSVLDILEELSVG